MNTKSFMINLYDLLAKNDIYNPRSSIDSTLEENIEKYCVDIDDEGDAKIRFYGNDNAEYQLTMTKIYRG